MAASPSSEGVAIAANLPLPYTVLRQATKDLRARPIRRRGYRCDNAVACRVIWRLKPDEAVRVLKRESNTDRRCIE